MIEWLANLDRALFYFINVHLANPVTDLSMPVLTSNTFLRAVYAIAIVLLLWKGSRQMRWAAIFSALTILVTDQVAAHLLKMLIARPRPCQTLMDIHLLINCGAGFSMPSAHAANAFGQAGFFSHQVRRIWGYLYVFAALIAVSRVFVGVHYPFDILVGSVLGVLIGVSMSFLAVSLLERLRMVPLQE